MPGGGRTKRSSSAVLELMKSKDDNIDDSGGAGDMSKPLILGMVRTPPPPPRVYSCGFDIPNIIFVKVFYFIRNLHVLFEEFEGTIFALIGKWHLLF